LSEECRRFVAFFAIEASIYLALHYRPRAHCENGLGQCPPSVTEARREERELDVPTFDVQRAARARPGKW
jgi:hypothetical protein